MRHGSRLARSLHLGLSAALMALGLTTVGVVAGSSAGSAAPLTSLTVRSSFPQGRIADADQVTVSLGVRGVPAASGASTGVDTGPQTRPGEVAGPVRAVGGTTYQIDETGPGATAPGYATSYECLGDTGAVLAAGPGTSGSITLPGDAGLVGRSVVCTFANVAQRPGVGVTVTGALSGDGPVAGSTVAWDVDVTNTGTATLTTVSVDAPALGVVECPPGSLAPAESRRCRVPSYVLTQDDVSRGSVSATVTATGTTDGEGLPAVTATDTVVVTIPALPRLVVTTTALPPVDVNGSGLVDAGDTIGYRFVVADTGNLPIADLTVGDPQLPGPVTCLATVLAPGESTTCSATFVHTITRAEQDAGRVVDLATASGTRPGGAAYTSEPGAATTPVQQPDPRLTVVASAGAVEDVNDDGLTDGGDRLTVGYTVTNAGNVPLTSVEVADAAVGAVTCEATELAVGDTTTCTSDAPYTVTAADVAAGRVVVASTARAVAPDGATTTSDPSALAVAVTARAPRLGLVAAVGSITDSSDGGAGDGLTDAGDRIVWTYTVTNVGNVAVTGVAISDPKAGAATCPGGPLAVGARLTCTSEPYVVTASDELAGRVRTTATASASDLEGRSAVSAPSTTSTVVVAPAPGLGIDKRGAPVDVDDSGTIDAGDTVDWTFVVRNTGNVRLSDVAVDDPALAAQSPPVTVTCVAATLDPGGATTCAASRSTSISETQEAARVVSNTATATATAPDGTAQESDPATANVPVTAAAAVLTLVKRAGRPVDVDDDGLVDAGDTIAYTFTVTNDGNLPVRGVTVSDPLAGAVVCDRTALPVGSTTACAATTPYVVTGLDQINGAVRNTAGARGTDPDGGVVRSNSASTTTPTRFVDAGLRLDKRAGTPVDRNADGLVDGGDTIVFTFVVTNAGNAPIDDLRVVDPKAGVVTCTAGVLAPGDVRTCTSRPYAISAADVGAGAVVNVARATGTVGGTGTVVSPSDSTTTPTSDPTPALSLSMTGEEPVDANASGLVDAGDTIRYTYVVTDTGNVPVTGVAVATRLGLSVVCDDTVLRPGERTGCRTRTAHVITPAEQAAGTVDNAGIAVATDPDGGRVLSTLVSTSQDVVTPAPSLRIDKSAGPPTDRNADALVDAGDTIVFSFLVTNTGDVPVSDIAVADPDAGVVSCPTPRLAVGEDTTCTSAPYSVTAADVASGAVVNVARASGTSPGGDPVRSATDSTSTSTTAPLPGLQVSLTQAPPVDVDGDALVDAGDTIAYGIEVTNTGNVPLSGLVVANRLVLPATCDLDVLAPGVTAQCPVTAPYVVTEADETTGSVVNAAAARATDPDGGTVTSNRDSTTQTLTAPAPRLGFDKRVGVPSDTNGDGLIDAGDTLVYTFVVTNTGNVSVSGVRVVDPRIASVSCPETVLAVGARTVCTSDPYVVTEADEAAGAVRNTAAVVGLDPRGRQVRSADDSVSTPVQTPAAALTIDKRAQPPVDVNASGTIDAGDTVQYVFTVRNVGDVPVSDVGVADPLAGSVTCRTTELTPAGTPGDTTECAADAPYAITADEEARQVVSNTANATGTALGETVVSDPDTVNVALAPDAAALTLAKRAGTPVDVNRDGIVDAGDTIAYTFVLTNAGNVVLRDAAVVDPLAGAVTCERTTLAVGTSTACAAVAPYVITTSDQAAGAVRNTAGAIAIDPDGTSVPANDDSTTTPVAVPQTTLALLVTQADPVDVNDSGLVDAGDTILYGYSVTNNGNVPLSSIQVTDGLGLGVTCTSTTLEVGTTATCTADGLYVVTAADEAAGSVNDVVTAYGSDPYGRIYVSNPSYASARVDTPAPAMTVDETAGQPVDVNGSGVTDAGDTIRYTFVATNTGNVPLADVAVADPLVDAVCPATTLAPQASTTCLGSPYRVTEADETAGAVVDTATATATDPDGGAVVSASDSTTTTVAAPAPSLMLDKSAGAPVDVNRSGQADAGDTIAYSFLVTNTGDVPVSGVTIDDDQLGPVTCPAATLDPTETTTCAGAPYVVTAADQDAGSVVNVATAAATDPDGLPVVSAPDSTSTPVLQPVATLTIDKTAGPPVDVNGSRLTDAGDTVDYTFVVTNTGNVPISGVAVVDQLVGGVTCPVTTLAPGEATTCGADTPYVVTEADVDAGAVLNSATATGAAPDGSPVTSAPDVTSTPTTRPAPSLSIDLRATLVESGTRSNDAGDAGEQIAYSFTVLNTGNVTLVGASVADPLVGGVTCPTTTLDPDESVECFPDADYTITETDVTVGSVVNTATALALDPNGEPVLSDPDEVATRTRQVEAGLVVDKQALLDDTNGDGVASQDETIEFTFGVVNRGNVALHDVRVVDRALGEVRCPLNTLQVGERTECVAAPYTVTKSDADAGSVDNVATAVGRTPEQDVTGSPTDSTATPTFRLEPTRADGPGSDPVGAGGDSGGLANTGGPSVWWLYLAAMLLLVGVITLMAGLFRRHPFDD